MTENFLLFGWEIFVNAVEVGFLLYLISYKLNCKYSKLYFYPVSFVILTLFTCLMNFFEVPPTISLLCLFIINIIYATSFFKNMLTEKLFWGGIYTFIEIFADKLSFWILSVFTSYHFSEFIAGGNARIPLSIFYMLTCFIFVLIFRKLKEKQFCLPKRFQAVLILLMTLSIIISDSLLGLIISIDSGTIPNNISQLLNKLNYLFLFLFLALLFMIKWVGSIYKKHLDLAETVKQHQIEQQQFEIFASTTQALREWKHDYKNNLAVISLLLDDENFEKAKSFINELMNSISDHFFLVSSGNSALDAIVSTKLCKAREHNIEFKHSIFLPSMIPFSALDFSALMGNLLDNAIEACMNVDSSAKPYIMLEMKPYQNMLYIQVENSSNGIYLYNSSGDLISIKSEKGHGIGIKRIKQVTEKYDGIYQQIPEEDKFTLTIMVPLKIMKGEHFNDYKISNSLGQSSCKIRY